MRTLLILFLLTLPHLIYGQEKLIIGSSQKVSYEPAHLYVELDSLVVVTEGGEITFCEDIEVYYAKNLSVLAYRSFQANDTCCTEDFYRNGQLKQRIAYFDFDSGWPLSHYSEFYCDNGQLLMKGRTGGSDETIHVVNYYCNGQKRNEFYRTGIIVDGKQTWWYENGNIKYEFYYKKNKDHGEWKYYNSDGTLHMTEFYENGKLIKTEE